MKYLSLWLLFLGLPVFGQAQKHLEGLWEGYITRGGIHAKDGYPFELFLEIKGKQLNGRSYIHIAKDQIIEMDIRGTIYMDQSIYLQDIRFIPLKDSQLAPGFYRRYQMVYQRSIWESTMEGYWQEVTDKPMNEQRQLGRIYLKKKEASKA
jgi:hypothetical protein